MTWIIDSKETEQEERRESMNAWGVESFIEACVLRLLLHYLVIFLLVIQAEQKTIRKMLIFKIKLSFVLFFYFSLYFPCFLYCVCVCGGKSI